MIPSLPLDIIDQIFRQLVAVPDLNASDDDRLIARGLPADEREQKEAFTPVSKYRQSLVNLLKVNRLWHAAGLRYLYSSLKIHRELNSKSKSVGVYLPLLLRTLKENRSLRRLVKSVAIFDQYLGERNISVKQEHYEELFRRCKSVTYLHIIVQTPNNPTKFQAAISRMKNLRKLVMTVRERIDRDDPQSKTFFRDDMEMVRFVMTMPNLEFFRFGDRVFSGSLEKLKIEPEETTEDAHDEVETVSKLTAEALPLCSTLRLNTLEILEGDILTEKGVNLLASLSLPHLKIVSLKLSPSEQAYTALLRCLKKWPETLESLHIRDEGICNEQIMYTTRNFDADYREAIDRFTYLSSISTRNEFVDLHYILSKPNLKEIVYSGQLRDEEFDFMTRKLEETVPGSRGTVYTYLPCLRSLKIYWGDKDLSPEDEYVKRMDAICYFRQMRLELVTNTVFVRHNDYRNSNYYHRFELAASVRSFSSLLCIY